jgi:Bacterial membrane protein YfhO
MSHRSHALIRHSLALLGLAALIIILYWPLFAARPGDQRSLSPGDLTSLFYPAAVYDVQQLRQGSLALWHPDVLGGHPYLAQLQTQVLYPLRWVTALLAIVISDGNLSYTGFAAEVIAHLVIAGWGGYLFFRRLSRSWAAGLFGGIAWGLSGYLTGYPIQHTPILYSAAWLPWLLWALDHVLSSPRLRWVFLAAICWAMPLLAGMPQNVFYIALVVVPFGVWRIGQAPSHARSSITKRVMLSLLLGAGLMAAQLLPALEILAYAERADWAFAQKATGFEVQDLIGLIYPRLTTWSPLYVGMPTLLLALAAVRSAGREARLWLGIALFGVALSLAAQTALFPWLYRAVPAFALFRNQERAALLVSWSLITLAVLGWPYVRSAFNEIRIGTILVIWWLIIITIAVWSSLQPANQQTQLHEQLSKAMWAPLIGLSAWATLHKITKGQGSKWTGSVLVALVVLDIGSITWQTAYTNHFVAQPPKKIATPIFTNELLPVEYRQSRIDTRGLLNKDQFVLSGIEDLHGQLPIELANFKRFRAEVPGERLWALMGVGCYARDQAEPALPFEASQIAEFTSSEEKQVGVYCLAQPFSRYRVLYEAKQFDDTTALVALHDDSFDPLRTAILDQPITLAARTINTPPQITIIAQQAQHTALQVTTAGEGILVIGDVFYPGWVARVDGARTPIIKAYSALRAVQIPAGTHETTLDFEPLSFLIGSILSVITLLAMLGLGLRHTRKLKTP